MASSTQTALQDLLATLAKDYPSLADMLLKLSQPTDADYRESGDDLPFSAVSQVRIHDIQGTGLRSPLEGQTVSNVPGIVTAVDRNGFYLQDPNPDSDLESSEGIFVFTSSAPTVAIGDSVLVNGRAVEFPSTTDTNNLSVTQIDRATITTLSTGNPLPESTRIGAGGRIPPTERISPDGILFYESLEGMRVTVQDAVAVSPTITNATNSTIWTVADRGAGATGINSRDGITISANDFNPERIQVNDSLLNGFSTPVVNVGYTLGDITGVVTYAFSNYRVLVTEPFSATSGGIQPESTNLAGTADRLTIASYNVENLFPGSGVRFEALGAHIARNLNSPDIVALQEIQDNNGTIDDGTVDASLTYQALINAIAAAGGPTYRFTDIAPTDGRDGGQPGANIRVGYLYNPARVGLVPDSVRRITDPTAVDGDGAFTASRKPLVATFTFNGQDVTTINNHLTSRSGSDPLFGSVQPPSSRGAERRVQQGEILNAEVDSLLGINPNANVVVLGDLNGFYFENFQQILRGGVLTNLYDSLPASERYSYVFQGNSQALDHIMVTNNLVSQARFDAVHVNSEFANQTSDHEPLVAQLFLGGSTTFRTVDTLGPQTETPLLVAQFAMNTSVV